MRLQRLRSWRDERGAVMVIAAAMMVAMLAMAAFAIDVGSWYQTKRQVQAAADAAALAGVQDLPGSASSAQTDAQSYVSKNISGATATVTTPYQSSSSEIQVSVTKTAPSFFGQLLGINSATITAGAAAKKNASATPSAVFSYDDSCSDQSMVLNGNSITITGGVHSNGSFFNNSNYGVYGASTYGGPNGCSYTGNGNNNTYGGASGPTVDAKLEPWPVNYATSPPACTYSASSFTWNTNDATLPAGVYCATGQISINGNDLSGDVTFVASSFNLNGNSENFTPYAQNLLIYQTGSNALDINGNDFVTLGTVFAPQATIVLNGNSGSVSGFLEGLDVTINGNSLTFVGTGPSQSGSSASLVQ
jgi:Flp pilus assembly protein TadG